MNIKNDCQQALLNLMAAKLRSFLAVLGILVGTAAVVALISCSQLATEKALAQFKALGTDLLAISLYQKSDGKKAKKQEALSLLEWRQLPERVPEILKIAPYGTAFQTISFQGKELQGSIIGADESLADIIHIAMGKGHFVSFVDSFEHFCVIGEGLAQQLKQISIEDPIGKPLRLGQTIYTVIGVAKPWKENGFFNEDINQAVIIPIGGLGLVSKEAQIFNAVLLLKPDIKIDEVIDNIKNIIAKQNPKLNMYVRSAKQIIESMEGQAKIFTLLLGVIGGIALLVGGIGVMNVMLVSVNERKKEIGIRKAVGATNQQIQTLFIVESIILSFLGGCLGVGLGLTVTRIIAYFTQWEFSFFLLPPLAGFCVSVATGVFFGFYPARRAALVDPMISLRSS